MVFKRDRNIKATPYPSSCSFKLGQAILQMMKIMRRKYTGVGEVLLLRQKEKKENNNVAIHPISDFHPSSLFSSPFYPPLPIILFIPPPQNSTSFSQLLVLWCGPIRCC
jgi:hypothetical protein